MLISLDAKEKQKDNYGSYKIFPTSELYSTSSCYQACTTFEALEQAVEKH